MKRFLTKIKKFCGRAGRKYGGRSFERIRRFVYDSFEIPARILSLSEIMGKRYREREDSIVFYDTTEAAFHSRQYCGEPLGERASEGVVCMFDGSLDHGGLTDRIRGILTTWHEVKTRKIPFYIYWDNPFPLDKFLEPATFDWRIPSGAISHNPDEAFPVMIEETKSWFTHLDNRLRLAAALRKSRKQTHVYTNADNARRHYPALYKELFKPTALLGNAVEKHLRELGDGYYAYSFRFLGMLGDFTDNADRTLPEEEAGKLMEKVTAEYLRASREVPEGRRILLAGDSLKFLHHLAAIDSRAYIVPGDVQHLDYAVGSTDDLWLKTFVDQHLLMNARKVTLMRTGGMYQSGFPRFAAEIGGTEFEDHIF